RAAGVPERRLLFRHALRVGANPLISLAGLSAAGLLSASLVIETIMSWPGLGPLMLDAVLARDLHVVVAAATCSTVLLIAGNLSARRTAWRGYLDCGCRAPRGRRRFLRRLDRCAHHAHRRAVCRRALVLPVVCGQDGDAAARRAGAGVPDDSGARRSRRLGTPCAAHSGCRPQRQDAGLRGGGEKPRRVQRPPAAQACAAAIDRRHVDTGG